MFLVFLLRHCKTYSMSGPGLRRSSFQRTCLCSERPVPCGLMVIHIKRSNLFPVRVAPSLGSICMCLQNFWHGCQLRSNSISPVSSALLLFIHRNNSHSAKNRTGRTFVLLRHTEMNAFLRGCWARDLVFKQAWILNNHWLSCLREGWSIVGASGQFHRTWLA